MPGGAPGGGGVPGVGRVDLDDQMTNVGVVPQGNKDRAQLGDVVVAVWLAGGVEVPVLVHPRPPGRPGVAQARTVGADCQRSIRHVSPLLLVRGRLPRTDTVTPASTPLGLADRGGR